MQTQPSDQTETDLEAELEAHIAEFVDDPLGFVMFVFAWGEGDLKDETGPDQWQIDLLKQIGDKCLTVETALRIAVTAGHGVGKSALVAWIILWFTSTRPNAAGVVTANTRSQLTGKTWRELALWHKRALNAHWFEWTATKFAHRSAPDTWAINAVAWSKNRPEAFAGLHAEHVLMIFDEASAIEDVIFDTAEGATTTAGALWLCFGNPTRATGRFREAFGRFRHRWITAVIDSRTAKKANQKQIAEWLADHGEDSDFFRIRVRGLFPAQSWVQFISTADVEAAMGRADSAFLTPVVIGVDVARFGDDKSVIVVREGNRVRQDMIKTFQGHDTVSVAGHVGELINRVSPQAVFVDGVGVGAGVVDILKDRGFRINEVNAGSSPRDTKKYYNLRAEMWGNMRDWIASPRSALPQIQQLRDDLTGIEYGFSTDGQIRLEKKDDMKARGLASPDWGDALALTFARPVASAEAQAAGLRGTGQRETNRGENTRAAFAARYRRR